MHIILILSTYLISTLTVAIARKVFMRQCTQSPSLQQAKRLQTVVQLCATVTQVILTVTAIIWLLRAVGLDPSPILASAGIVGLAVGFGAQTLVRDFLSGIFIILENQYGVGDRVKINSQEGEVTSVTIRHTVLRDDDNNLVYIPHGSINLVVNVRNTPQNKTAL